MKIHYQTFNKKQLEFFIAYYECEMRILTRMLDDEAFADKTEADQLFKRDALIGQIQYYEDEIRRVQRIIYQLHD